MEEKQVAIASLVGRKEGRLEGRLVDGDRDGVG